MTAACGGAVDTGRFFRSASEVSSPGPDNMPYAQIWAVDFEFIAADGERPVPVCLVARELRSDRLLRFWQDELATMASPPYSTGSEALFVAYFAAAELSCHLTLGWPLPVRILDLFTEFRAKTNGRQPIGGNGLLGALTAHGLDGMGGDEKRDMRELIMAGGPWSPDERQAILDYCQSDVDALARLLPAMLPGILGRRGGPRIALGHALLRGRYMAAVARMEHRGTPIDVDALMSLREHWDAVKQYLVDSIDRDFGVYDGQSFRQGRFEAMLAQLGIPWPRLPSGALDLKDETFREMARAYPQIAPLRELRHSLGQLRLEKLQVGSDGRNRCLLSPFSSKTGRNQPSNNASIFGPSAWLRSLIKPKPGHGLAYVDFVSQEICIAAALSGDPVLMDAYQSGDPYLAFAIQAGLVPESATKASHKVERDRCKAVVLGINYGMGIEAMASRIGITPAEARLLLDLHKRHYPKFWAWIQAAVDHGMLFNEIHTVFGWRLLIESGTRPTSLMNFPMQANGAEMLRLACCLATEDDLAVCCPIHDALLIEAPLDQLDDHVKRLRQHMAEASRVVLDGFEIRTDVSLVRWPERHQDERGMVMWERVMKLLAEVKKKAA